MTREVQLAAQSAAQLRVVRPLVTMPGAGAPGLSTDESTRPLEWSPLRDALGAVAPGAEQAASWAAETYLSRGSALNLPSVPAMPPASQAASSAGAAPRCAYGTCSCKTCLKKGEDSQPRIDNMRSSLLAFYSRINKGAFSELCRKLRQVVETLQAEGKETASDVSSHVAEAIFCALEEGDLEE